MFLLIIFLLKIPPSPVPMCFFFDSFLRTEVFVLGWFTTFDAIPLLLFEFLFEFLEFKGILPKLLICLYVIILEWGIH